MREMPDVIVLCGGSGLRLKHITGNLPKVLAKVSGRPFLELLISQLSRSGFQRVILATGPHYAAVRKHLGAREIGVEFIYPEEPVPLGTGGAIRNAARFVESEEVLIMNGDSYTEVQLDRFVYRCRRSRDDARIVVVPTDGRKDCGTVVVSENGTIVRFEEKQTSFLPRFINAGIYLVSLPLVLTIPPGLACSWETDILPRRVAEGWRIGAFFCSSRCTDIGTPARYRNAQHILANAETQI